MHAPAAPAATRTVTFEVGDPALLCHPSLQLVVADATSGRLAPLAWQRDPDGRVAAEVATGQGSVGLSVVLPALEVLAWIPLDPRRTGR